MHENLGMGLEMRLYNSMCSSLRVDISGMQDYYIEIDNKPSIFSPNH